MQKYCRIIQDACSNMAGLVERGEQHDKSKLVEPELGPYIEMTWQYKMANGKPIIFTTDMTRAWMHHTKVNTHHPEHFDSPSAMTDIDIAEMVADWAAMSEEIGNSLHEWFLKNNRSRWWFTPHQEQLISKLIDICETEMPERSVL